MVINLVIIYIIGFMLTAYVAVKLEGDHESADYWLAILITFEALMWPLLVPFLLLALFIKVLFIKGI